MAEQDKRAGTLTKGESVKLQYVLGLVEKVIRMLLGQVRYINLTEADEIVLLPYMRAHVASDQDMNLAYVEEFDKVFVMSDDPPGNVPGQ